MEKLVRQPDQVEAEREADQRVDDVGYEVPNARVVMRKVLQVDSEEQVHEVDEHRGEDLLRSVEEKNMPLSPGVLEEPLDCSGYGSVPRKRRQTG